MSKTTPAQLRADRILHFRMTGEEAAILDAACEKLGITRTELMRRSLDELLNTDRFSDRQDRRFNAGEPPFVCFNPHCHKRTHRLVGEPGVCFECFHAQRLTEA